MIESATSLDQARANAKTRYARMRTEGECAIALGRFYLSLLAGAVWASQSDLSNALAVSKGQVSKSIKAARLPASVRKVFSDERRISFGTADVIDQIARQIGRERLVAHATRLGSRADLSVKEILAALARGSLPDKPRGVRISSRRGEDFIRLYSPHLRKMNRNLPRVEDYIDFAMKMMGYE
ncbi:hypothetical protein [Paraburkholderia gardini]|uniref:hypothetical protein n=1 Tax=Paraburkholderia gardini TaxID=2823469 RepID=UPI001DDF1C8F|nr:hypothetical protein [Paraburkholderia gardini]CAG4914363.1 hypothetical protein R69919_04196 [Paraburkholderia gardini]